MKGDRFYRHYFSASDLFTFKVNIKETDLWIAVDRESYQCSLQRELEENIWKKRIELEHFIAVNPSFKASLKPYLPGLEGVPPVAWEMLQAGNRVGVGPMAAVAGTFAAIAGKYLLNQGVKEVIVENGGDIFMSTGQPRRIGIYAGSSPLSGKIGLEIQPGQTPLGICTSSGTVGHSYSQGKADAVIALSPRVALADAAATSLANLVQDKLDLQEAVNRGKKLEDITGVVAICSDRIAAWGEIQLCRLPLVEVQKEAPVKEDE